MPGRRLIHFSRELRKGSTDVERCIWSQLRKGKLKGHIFRRQHPLCGYIADFYCHAERPIVELDGGQHNEQDAIEYERRRTAAMEAEGVRVIRFSDYDALKNTEAVMLEILKAVEEQLGKQPPP